MDGWPFVGRDELVAAIARDISGHPKHTGVLVTGRAGEGKTRLIHAVATALAEGGHMIRSFTGSSASRPLPLGPFFDLFVQAGRWDDGRPAVARCVSQLEALAGRRRGVVVIDDVHELDPLSIFLIQRLIESPRLALILGARTGVPLAPALAKITASESFTRIDIRPLTGEDVRGVLRGVSPGSRVESEVATTMLRLSDGNPLYLRLLLEATDGPAFDAGETWLLRESWSFPGALHDLIGSRIAGLDQDVIDVLDVVTLTEPIGLDAAEAIFGETSAIERAENEGIVRVNGRMPRVTLAHPLYGQIRRRDMGTTRAHRLRQRAASVLREHINSHDLILVAQLLTDIQPADEPLLTRAIAAAFDRLDLETVYGLASAAVAAGHGRASMLALAYAASWTSRGEEAEAAGVLLSATDYNDQNIVETALMRAGNHLFALGSAEDAQRMLDAVEAHATTPLLWSEWAGMRAWTAAFTGDSNTAATLVRKMSEHGGLTGRGRSLASVAEAASLGAQGRIRELRRLIEREAGQEPNSFDAGMVRVAFAEVCLWGLRLAGLGREANEIARRQENTLRDIPGLFGSMATALRGYAYLAMGELNAASSALRLALHRLAADRTGWRFAVLLSLAQARALIGDHHVAAELLGQAESASHGAFVFRRLEVDVAHGWLEASVGDIDRALQTFLSAAQRARDDGQPAYEVLALHNAVRLGAIEPRDRLAELADVVDAPRASLAARQATALKEFDGKNLLAVSIEFEAIGALSEAADAAAQASSAMRRAGRGRDGASVGFRAGELARRMCGARTPAIVNCLQLAPLTGQEAAVTRLAASGLSNRDIGKRLDVSVRTVEYHLYRAFGKLGVTSRHDLAQLLSRPAPE